MMRFYRERNKAQSGEIDIDDVDVSTMNSAFGI